MTDECRLFGVGFALLHKHKGAGYNMVQAGSYSLTPAQTRYSATELETLGVMIACEKCEYFLKGLNHFEAVSYTHLTLPTICSV